MYTPISHANKSSLKKEARSTQKALKAFLKTTANSNAAINKRLKAYFLNPYFPKSWSIESQFDAISTHYQLLQDLPHFFDVANGIPKELINFSTYSDGARLACGRPKWPDSEGEIALHLIKNNATVMTIPFTLGTVEDELVIYLWSIQKPSADTSHLIPIYKDFSGLRAQDLMIEMLRLLAKKIGAKKILAMADESWNQQSSMLCDWIRFSYDDVWLSQSGVKLANGFFDIPIQVSQPTLEATPIYKRAAINKRYAILESISNAFDQLLPDGHLGQS